MKIWCISDTHGKHGFLDIPQDVDMVIHAGDMSNYRDTVRNTNEVLDFLEWFNSLVHIKHKVLIAGNHDTSIERQAVVVKTVLKNGIYLRHESVEIAGLKIFGSPYTPTFGDGWSFNVSRQRLSEYWKHIPFDTDILITHGPPKGVLDLTAADTGSYSEQCGCKALLNYVKRIQPKLHIFGHIHPEENCHNAGILQIQGCKTQFINAAVVNLRLESHNNGHIITV